MDNIFENMSQQTFDQLSKDEDYAKVLSEESLKIADIRINEAKNADDWMTLDELSCELENEIRAMYK